MSVIYHLQGLAQLMKLGKRFSYGAALKSKRKVVRPKTSMLLLYQYTNLERLVFLIVQYICDWVDVLIIFPTVACVATSTDIKVLP